MKKNYRKQNEDRIRKYYKEKFGIVESNSTRKTCRTCFHYTEAGKVCSKHGVRTQKTETCPSFTRTPPKQTVSGGLVRPK